MRVSRAETADPQEDEFQKARAWEDVRSSSSLPLASLGESSEPPSDPSNDPDRELSTDSAAAAMSSSSYLRRWVRVTPRHIDNVLLLRHLPTQMGGGHAPQHNRCAATLA